MKLFDVLRTVENGVYIPCYFKPVPMKKAQELLLKAVKGKSTSIRIVPKGKGWRDVVTSYGGRSVLSNKSCAEDDE